MEELGRASPGAPRFNIRARESDGRDDPQDPFGVLAVVRGRQWAGLLGPGPRRPRPLVPPRGEDRRHRFRRP